MLNVYRQLKNEKDELFQQQITSDPAAKKPESAQRRRNEMKSNFISNATKKTASKQNQHSNIQEELSGSWTVRQNRAMAKKSMMISAASAQVEKKKKKLTSSQMTP